MTSLPSTDLTWRSYAWRGAIFVAPAALLGAADLLGLLPIDSLRLLVPMMLIGALLVLGADAMRRKSRWAGTYLVLALVGAQGIIQTESMMGKLQAQWRIARNVACLDEVPNAQAVCAASYDPCNVAYDLRHCWAGLYRDAGWREPDLSLLEEGARQQREAARSRTNS